MNAARTPTWAWALLVVNVVTLTAWILDNFVLAREVEFVWVAPSATGESTSEERLVVRRPDVVGGWRLVVHGRVTPMQFFDLDNYFSVSLTRGGYRIGLDYDLVNGAEDYEAYLRKCRVEWESDRVRFVEPRGYELVFPAREMKLVDRER